MYVSHCRSGMLMDDQLSTRNMVSAVNEEFWKMVKESIDEQTVLFSGRALRHMHRIQTCYTIHPHFCTHMHTHTHTHTHNDT